MDSRGAWLLPERMALKRPHGAIPKGCVQCNHDLSGDGGSGTGITASTCLCRDAGILRGSILSFAERRGLATQSVVVIV